MRRITATAAATVVAGLILLPAPAARAATADGFHLVGQSVTVDATATATFQLTFDREPRFFLPEGATEQPDTFQIEIDGDNTTFAQPLVFDEIDSIVRGGEIFGGAELPIRDRDGDGGPTAGGWGAVRATVPFQLEATTLTFTAGLDTLGDADGKFRYRIITTEDGALTSEINAAIIPLPAGAWAGMMLLGGAGVLHALRKR
jgi:hypothetical protein